MYGSPLFCLASEREEVLKCKSACVVCFFPSAAVAVHVLREGRGTDERRLKGFPSKEGQVSAAWWPLQTPSYSGMVVAQLEVASRWSRAAFCQCHAPRCRVLCLVLVGGRAAEISV